TYLEAARSLAEKVILSGGKDTPGRVRLAFQLATSRQPDARETKLLAGLAEKQRTAYRRDPESAKKLVSEGESKRSTDIDVSELAAWMAVSSAILNLDEVITKE